MKRTEFYDESVDILPDSLDEFIKILKKVKKDNKRYTNFTIRIYNVMDYDNNQETHLKICGEKITK